MKLVNAGILIAAGLTLARLPCVLAAAGPEVPPVTTSTKVPRKVPGIVIDHSPAASGLYIGSPSIAVLTNGDYVASHDFFGPKSREHEKASSVVFRSTDRGNTWRKVSEIYGAFWSSLFVHRGALYLLGPDRHHGYIQIRRSTDGGEHWTSPTNSRTGLLRDNAQYHCAPMPVVEHKGRLWRAFEDATGGTKWGERYLAGMLSVPVDADLLDAASWISSNFLPSNRSWNGGDMGGWLEGNAVILRDGRLLDILRVETRTCPEKAALVNISADGKTASFDPATGFVNFPGGAKKFTIRYDARSDRYWSLATIVPERFQKSGRPGGIRNTLALTCSEDLRNWTIRCILLHHPDVAKHGFQYVDWLFEGDDIIAACRTAYDDGDGGANNNHDANFLTFHRITNFRTKTLADSVPLSAIAPQREETGDFVLGGHGWALKKFADHEQAFANRAYVWQEVPAEFRGWQFTQTAGNERAEITAKARRDATVYFATTLDQRRIDSAGWSPIAGTTFCYTDSLKTKMSINRRTLKAGEEVVIPQGNWTGGLLLIPPADKTN